MVSGRSTNKQIRRGRRFHLLDGIRGITLISMILYHASWDAVYLLGADWAWYRGPAAHLWQQSICWTFILLSGFCFPFGRKKLRRVDRDLLLLGGFYLAVAAFFVAFECFPVNFRPVLIEGRLEASYPSSTTLLAMCVLPTAWMQLRRRIRHPWLLRLAAGAVWGLTALLVVGRIFSGVHWISDIIGGGLLSAGLVTLYGALVKTKA